MITAFYEEFVPSSVLTISSCTHARRGEGFGSGRADGKDRPHKRDDCAARTKLISLPRFCRARLVENFRHGRLSQAFIEDSEAILAKELSIAPECS